MQVMQLSICHVGLICGYNYVTSDVLSTIDIFMIAHSINFATF